jgi:hypothetical protein
MGFEGDAMGRGNPPGIMSGFGVHGSMNCSHGLKIKTM